MEPPAAGNVNTSAGAGSSMYVRPPPLHAVMQSWRGGRFFHGRSACNPAARMLRKDGLHALLQRFRHVLQDLLQPLRFGLQCCAYKFNPPSFIGRGDEKSFSKNSSPKAILPSDRSALLMADSRTERLGAAWPIGLTAGMTSSSPTSIARSKAGRSMVPASYTVPSPSEVACRMRRSKA